MHHHLLVGNTNVAAFSLVYDTNMAAFSLVYDTNMAAFLLVYDTNMAAVTSLKTLYGLVIISRDCMLVPVRCRKKYRENAKRFSLLVFFVRSCVLNLLKYD